MTPWRHPSACPFEPPGGVRQVGDAENRRRSVGEALALDMLLDAERLAADVLAEAARQAEVILGEARQAASGVTVEMRAVLDEVVHARTAEVLSALGETRQELKAAMEAVRRPFEPVTLPHPKVRAQRGNDSPAPSPLAPAASTVELPDPDDAFRVTIFRAITGRDPVAAPGGSIVERGEALRTAAASAAQRAAAERFAVQGEALERQAARRRTTGSLPGSSAIAQV